MHWPLGSADDDPGEAPRIEFDDLLDIPAANDVETRGPALRGLPRWAISASFGIQTEDNLYAGLSYDVSAGDFFVATFDAPPIGARVDVSVRRYPTGAS